MPPLALVGGQLQVETGLTATGGFRPGADVPHADCPGKPLTDDAYANQSKVIWVPRAI